MHAEGRPRFRCRGRTGPSSRKTIKMPERKRLRSGVGELPSVAMITKFLGYASSTARSVSR